MHSNARTCLRRARVRAAASHTRGTHRPPRRGVLPRGCWQGKGVAAEVARTSHVVNVEHAATHEAYDRKTDLVERKLEDAPVEDASGASRLRTRSRPSATLRAVERGAGGLRTARTKAAALG